MCHFAIAIEGIVAGAGSHSSIRSRLSLFNPRKMRRDSRKCNRKLLFESLRWNVVGRTALLVTQKGNQQREICLSRDTNAAPVGHSVPVNDLE